MAGKEVDPLVPRSLTEIVVAKIRQMIIDGAVEFGQQITESELSERFKLSKTPIREALIQLNTEGLVDIKPRSGTFIFSLTEKEIDDICFLRISLEQAAIKASMIHGNKIRMLSALAKNIKDSAPLKERYRLPLYLKLDAEFHDTFMTFADNPYLIAARRPISIKIMAMRNRVAFSSDFINNSIEEHSEILKYLMNDDINTACFKLEEHINNGFSIQAKQNLISDV